MEHRRNTGEENTDRKNVGTGNTGGDNTGGKNTDYGWNTSGKINVGGNAMEDIQGDDSTGFEGAMTRGRMRGKNASKENADERDDREDVQRYGDVTVFEGAITTARKGRRRGY